jgi:hypothetical protein
MGGAGGAGGETDGGPRPDAEVSMDGLSLEVRNLACEGTCTQVQAAAGGGLPPYHFEWHDGVTNSTRLLCPADDGFAFVRVTDSRPTEGEFAADDPGLVQASADLRGCDVQDGCTTDRSVTPTPGRYAGTFTCGQGQDIAPGGTVVADIEAAGGDGAPTGTLWLQWDLFVIGGDGELMGTLDCDTAAFQALWSGLWGVPGAADATDPRNPPYTLLPLGTVTGQTVLSTSAGDPDEITGTFEWLAPPVVPGDAPSECLDGTITLHREPNSQP